MVRALRAPLRRLVWLMVAELAGLAGALGIAMGYWVAAALMPDVAATLRGLYGAEVAGQLAVRPVWWISGLAIALGGAGLAAGGSLWGLARMPLLAGAHPRAWAMARQGRGAALGAAGLLALAGGLAVRGHGLIAGQPARVYGVRDHATYRDNWHLLRAAPQVWDRLAAGQGVLVNEQLFRRAGTLLHKSAADRPFPFPGQSYPATICDGRTERGEAVEDGDTDLELRDLTVEVPR